MCLNIITKRYCPPDMGVRTAYKIVEKGNLTPFMHHPLLPEWQKADSVDIICSEDWYVSGFHVYPTRQSARTALKLLRLYGSSANLGRFICKVEVKGITCEGTDGTSLSSKFWGAEIPNLVAQWIRLVPGKV